MYSAAITNPTVWVGGLRPHGSLRLSAFTRFSYFPGQWAVDTSFGGVGQSTDKNNSASGAVDHEEGTQRGKEHSCFTPLRNPANGKLGRARALFARIGMSCVYSGGRGGIIVGRLKIPQLWEINGLLWGRSFIFLVV